tara:strand:- start:1081 stop:1803 length:723 start_codon:yes stop_codon:yes gene_type:complete
MLYTDTKKILSGYDTDRKINQIERRVVRYITYSDRGFTNNEKMNYLDNRNVRILINQYIDFINYALIQLRSSATTEPTVCDFGGGIGIGEMVMDSFFPGQSRPFNFYTLTRSSVTVDGQIYARYGHWLAEFDITSYAYGGDINEPDIKPIVAYTQPPHKADYFIMHRVPENRLNAWDAVLSSPYAKSSAQVIKRHNGGKIRTYWESEELGPAYKKVGNASMLDKYTSQIRSANDELFKDI